MCLQKKIFDLRLRNSNGHLPQFGIKMNITKIENDTN